MCKAFYYCYIVQSFLLFFFESTKSQSLDNFALIFSSDVLNGVYGQTTYYKLNLNNGEQEFLRQWQGGIRLPHCAVLDPTGQNMFFVWEQWFGSHLMSYISRISLYDTSSFGDPYIFGEIIFDNQENLDGTLFPLGSGNTKFYQIQRLVIPRNPTFFITIENMPNDLMLIRRLDIAQNYAKTLATSSIAYTGFGHVDVAPSGKFIVYSKKHELFMYTFPLNTSKFTVATGILNALSSGIYGYLDGNYTETQLTELSGLVISPDESWVFFVHFYNEKYYLRGVYVSTLVSYTFFWIDNLGVSVLSLSMGNSPDVLWLCTVTGILEFKIRPQSFQLIRTFVTSYTRALSVWTRQLNNYPGYDTATNYKFVQPCASEFFSVSLVTCLVQNQFVLEPPNQPLVLITEAETTTTTSVALTTSSTTARQSTSTTVALTTQTPVPTVTAVVQRWVSLPFPRVSHFSTFESFKQSNFLLIYTNTDRTVSYRSGASSYFFLDLNTTALRFLFSYDAFSMVGTLRAILDSTGNFAYVITVDNYKSQIFKKNLRENLPWEAVVNPDALHILPDGGFADGTLSTARFGYITRVLSPRNFTFFLIADCDSRAIRRVDFESNIVKTLIDGMPYQQFLALDLSPSGNFFVWEQNNMLFMYVFPLNWISSAVSDESMFILTAGGEGYRDGDVNSAKISYVKSMVISPDDKWLYFAHNYLTGMYIRGTNLATKVTYTFYSNISTSQQPTFLAMGMSPDVLWVSCVNPGSIWQFRIETSSMTVMAYYSVNNVMSMSVWTSYVWNKPGFDAFSDYRFLQQCPQGKYDSGMMYCEDCPRFTFNVEYAATACSQCPSSESMVITGTTNPYAAENACQFNKTTTEVHLTTTKANVLTTTPSFPLPIQPLKRISVSVGEYCTDFRPSSIDLRGVWDCGLISNTFGCNGSWALTGYNGVVCPWEFGQGCSASIYPNWETEACYVNCESGCLNKSKCTNLPKNAYFTGVGDYNDNNCTWLCNSDYYQVAQECVKDETKNTPQPPSTTIKRCLSYLDCSHCPIKGFNSDNSLYRVMGCSGYGVHLYVEGINYGTLDSLTYFLSSAYCVYYLNYSYAEYCPDPVTTTTTPATTSTPVVSISTNVILATTTAFTNPRFTCTSYKNCSHCPAAFTKGCTGVTIIQRFPNGMYGVIFSKYTPSGMMQGKCVYNDDTWKYCPENNLVFSEPQVAKVVLGFSFSVPEAIINATVLLKYKKIIADYLNISQNIIFLTLSSSIQRRLLAANVVYGNLELEPNEASSIINLMNSQGFKNALLDASANVIGPVINYNEADVVNILPYSTTSQSVDDFNNWHYYEDPKVQTFHVESWNFSNLAPFLIFVAVMFGVCITACVCLYFQHQNTIQSQQYENETLIQNQRNFEYKTNQDIQNVLWKKIEKNSR